MLQNQKMNREELIKERAYQIYEQSGNSDTIANYYQAEQELQTEGAFNECVVCLDQLAVAGDVRCGHRCFCVDCLSHTVLQSRGDFNCPLCRKKINFVTGINWSQICGDLLATESCRQIYYERLLTYMEILAKTTRPFTNTDLVVVLDQWFDIYQSSLGVDQEGKLLMLTVDQVETLFMKIKDHPGEDRQFILSMEKLFVQNCVTPWSVDVRVASAGVCYYGNLGNVPTLERGFTILGQNYCNFQSSLLKQKFTSL